MTFFSNFYRNVSAVVMALTFSHVMCAQDDGLMTLKQIFHPDKKISFIEAKFPDLRWLPDGSLAELASKKDKPMWWKVDIVTGDKTPLLDLDILGPAFIAAGGQSEQSDKFLSGIIQWSSDASFLIVKVANDFWQVHVATHTVLRLTEDGIEKREALLSPDGKKCAFVRKNDLFFIDLATRRETRLTTDGSDNIYNGINDWVYWEEVLNRATYRAFWWSPDSQRLAFLRFDESRVPVFTILDDRVYPQRPLLAHYPKVGDPLPTVQIGVVDLAGKNIWLDDPYAGKESIIGRVSWSTDGHVVASYLDRQQSWLELRRFEGTGSKVLLKEVTPGWQDILPEPRWLSDGSFLWESDRSGHRHLYRHAADGTVRNAVTAGDWQLRKVHGVSPDGSTVLVDTNEKNAIGIDTFRCAIDGSTHDKVTDETGGVHAVRWNATFSAYLDNWSYLTQPARLALYHGDGKKVRTIAETKTERMNTLRLGKISTQQIPTRDGFMMESMLVLPIDFDPAKKYPVMQEIYGGPEIPSVRDAWTGNFWWWQYLAQHGVITWVCDNRSASHKDVMSARSVHRRLGEQELADQLDGLAWLGKQGWADMSRVGITGVSYGGFMTSYSLLHSKAYRLGVACCLVADMRLYDCIYAERLMDLIGVNEAGYNQSSLMTAAKDLSGHLVVVHGALDDNAHFQNSVQLIDALQHAGHDVELRYLPGTAHGLGDAWQRWCHYQAMWSLIQRDLSVAATVQ